MDVFKLTFRFQPGTESCQVINRKKYDTETADLLWSVRYQDDYTNRGVALFQKKNGEYFKYDIIFASLEGKWNQPVLTPLTEEEAKDLTEKFSPDEYIDIFGEVEE